MGQMEQLYLQRRNIFCITTPKIILNSKPYKPQEAHMKFCHTRHLGPCPNALKHLARAQIHFFQRKSHPASHMQIYCHIHLEPSNTRPDTPAAQQCCWVTVTSVVHKVHVKWAPTPPVSLGKAPSQPPITMNHRLAAALSRRKDSVLNTFDGSSGTRQTIMSAWISSHTPPDYYFRKKPHKTKPV